MEKYQIFESGQHAIYFAKLDIPSLIVYGGQEANVPVEASLENLREIQQDLASLPNSHKISG